MGLLCFMFIVAALVMEYLCLQELATRGEPYYYFKQVGTWDMICFAWSNTVYFKYWIGCVILSIICHPVWGGLTTMLVVPGLYLAISIFHLPSIEPIIPGQWELFGGSVSMWLALGVLILASPIILVGAVTDVEQEMEKERREQEKERQDSRYPFDEDFARAADGLFK
ncbi:MAG: hypothetical protein IJ824_06260 [Alphaproteobacteria bacterium]|nr:hypothetical protein [Alphaproteobacteria bacterium]